MDQWTLDTPRCILRPAQPNDLPYLVSAIRSPAFPPRLPLLQMQKDGGLRQWLEQMCRRTIAGSAVCISIDSRAHGSSCIGQISLVPKTAPSAWNIAFWLDPGYWGRGLATESVSRALRAAFGNLDCSVIHAGVAHWNSASIRTIERLAFRYTGDNPAGYFVAGAPEAIHEYALTRGDWQSGTGNP